MTANIIAHASNSIITQALHQSDTQNFAKGNFINPTNRYIGFNTNLEDIETSPNNIRHSDLSEYIATSTISHCYEGWNYFSRGIEALINGDIPTCIHLIYYAELRSIMSIMATEGIGVFNNKHVYYDRHQNAHTFNSPTHTVTNDLIKSWADNPNRKDKVFNTIQLKNFTLGDWIQATGKAMGGGYATAMVNDWFTNWSLDIRLEADKKLRNEMSYRPHFDYKSVDISKLLDKLTGIWESLEPLESNRFPNLDMHLSRLGIETLFTKSTGELPSHSSYEKFLRQTFETIGEPTKQSLFEFFLRNESPENHLVIAEATGDLLDNRVNLANPLPMICRALLLLRFATGFTNQTLNDSGVNPLNLRFWWEDIASKIGIVDAPGVGVETMDLFADVRESLGALNSQKADITTIWQANLFGYPDLNTLKQFQRVCFWGLGI